MMFQLLASLLVVTAGSADAVVLHGHSHPVWSVQFSPDNSSLASASSTCDGKDPEIRVWDLKTRTVRWKVSPFAQWVFDVQLDPDGGFVLATDHQSTIKQWNLRTGKLRNEMRTPKIETVRYSPNGRFVGAGSRSGQVHVWDSESGRLVHRLKGHTADVWSIAFSPDGKYIASASADHDVRVWLTNTGELHHAFSGHEDDVTALRFTPGGLLLSGGFDNRIILWDVAGKRRVESSIARHRFGIATEGLRMPPDGAVLISVGSPSQIHSPSVAIWDANTLQGRGELLETSASIKETAFSRDGSTLFVSAWDRSIVAWDIARARRSGRLRGHTEYVRCLAVSPDGKLLASGSDDTTIRLWPIRSQD